MSTNAPIGSTPFIGRKRELAVLTARLAEAHAGRGGVSLVGGEPGIGKTRLERELSERARAAGWLVLAGRAYDSEAVSSYLPFIEALRPYVRACTQDELQAQLADGAADIALLVREVRSRLPDLPESPALSSEAMRFRLFESVTDFLCSAARAARIGLLLVLDDLHWMDTASLLLFQHVSRRITGVPLLMVGTYRTVSLDRSRTFDTILAGLHRERLADSLTLPSLARDEVAAFVEMLVGVAPAPDVLDTLDRETEGNPFFIEEVVQQLQAEGRDLADPKDMAEQWTVPEGVRDVIGARLARLSVTANRVLQVGAVAGDGFTSATVRAVLDLEQEPLLEALDEALGAGMLREEGAEFHFRHPLIRRTMYEALALGRRQRLHVQVAIAIEQSRERHTSSYATALATHYRLAGATADVGKVIDASRQAAKAAAAVFAWEEAIGHVQTAIELLDPADEQGRCSLLLELGEAQMRAGEQSDARATFQRAAAVARSANAPEQLARAALGLGGDWIEPLVVDETLIALLDEALNALGPHGGVLRARVLARLAQERRFEELYGGPALSEQAIQAANQANDSTALGHALVANYIARWRPDTVEERHGLATAMVHIAERNGNRELALRGHIFVLNHAAEVGDIPALDAGIELCTQLAATLRQPLYAWHIALIKATQATLHARFEDAERLARAALDAGHVLHGLGPKVAFAQQLFCIGRERGRFEEAEVTLKGLLEHDVLRFPWKLRVLLPCLDGESGRIPVARVEFAQVAARDFSDIPRDADWLWNITNLARLCALLGDTERAHALYELLAPFAGLNVVTAPDVCVCNGLVDRYLGLLASTMSMWPEAVQHFEDACGISTRMGTSHFLAHTLREYATMLLARRRQADQSHARELLTQALSIYGDLGMHHYAAKAKALLHRSRLAKQPRVSAYPNNLTLREVEVLRLIAAAKSNNQIAEELVISHNTVIRHVSTILVKTNAANRVAAAAFAHEQGLA